jgi:hypothetical protein
MIMERTTTAKTLAIAAVTTLGLGITPLARAVHVLTNDDVFSGKFDPIG